MTDLTEKVILITGAGWSPGPEVALAFAAQGARVAVSDLTPVNLDPIVEEIRSQGGIAELIDADISKKIPAQTMITAIVEKWNRIDILVNIAGIRPKGALLDLDEWDWRRAIDVNLTGPFLTTQIVGRVMREIGGGRIIYLAEASRGGQNESDQAAFKTAMAGLKGLTQSAAVELAKYNIAVNAVFHSQVSPAQTFPELTPDADALLAGANTLAEAAARLASPTAALITGQVIVI